MDVSAHFSALDDEEFFVVEGSGWRGRRESDSQVFCHTNSVHALACVDKDMRQVILSAPPPPPPLSPCVRSKRTPCAHSTRPRVYWHHARKCYHMRAWCRYTRGRFERTHGDFQRATPHRTHTPRPQRHTRHNNHHNNTRRQGQTGTKIDRDRERQRN